MIRLGSGLDIILRKLYFVEKNINTADEDPINKKTKKRKSKPFIIQNHTPQIVIGEMADHVSK